MNAKLMDPDEDHIDRLLSQQEQVVASAGFTASVMEAVRREAAEPAPIPFPWKRALPVLALAGLTVVCVPILAVTSLLSLAKAPVSAASVDMNFFWAQLSLWTSHPAAAWTIGSLLLALIAVKFSMQLASR